MAESRKSYTRLPRRINKNLFRQAQYAQALYNRDKSRATALEVGGKFNEGAALMAAEGRGGYRRGRRYSRRYRSYGRYRGRGGFWDDVKSSWNHYAAPVVSHALRTYGGDAGELAGRTFLGPEGASLGREAGTLGGNWLAGKIGGMGSYNNNSLILSAHDGVPKFDQIQDETGALCVTHEEYMGDVFVQNLVGAAGGTAPYQLLQSVVLNPGLATSFPWLSQLASNYEEYEFHGLIFTFKTTMADVNTSNTSIGTVMMVTNYNAANSGSVIPSVPYQIVSNAATTVFSSKQQLLEYDASQSDKVSNSQHHGVECDPTKNGMSAILYTRSGPVPSGQDKKTYDLGVFQLFSQGINLSGNVGGQIGELYCSYKVVLRKPKIFTALGYNIPQDVFESATSAIASATDTFGSATGLTGTSTNLLITIPSGFTGSAPIVGQRVWGENTVYGLFSAVIMGVTNVSGNLALTISGGGFNFQPTAAVYWGNCNVQSAISSIPGLSTNSIGGVLSVVASPNAANGTILQYSFPVDIVGGSYRVTLRYGGLSFVDESTQTFLTNLVNCSTVGDIVGFSSSSTVSYPSIMFIADILVTSPGVSQASFQLVTPPYLNLSLNTTYVNWQNFYFDIQGYNPLSTA